jgi:hypothetical protein
MEKRVFTNKEKYLVWGMFVFLLVSGLFHVSMQELAGEVLSNPNVIRIIGFVVLIFGLFHLSIKKRYFRFIGIFITWHGIWRLFLPASSISTQESTYPRWVHGILILVTAVALLYIPYRLYNTRNNNN